MWRVILVCTAWACTPAPQPAMVDATRVDGAIDAASADATTMDAADLSGDRAVADMPDLRDAQGVDARSPDARPRDADLPDMAVAPLCAVTGPTPLRRLTPTQYRNSAQALGLDTDGLALTEADGPLISQLAAERFVTAAKVLAGRAEIPPCDPLEDEVACVDAYILGMAADAFRRPLTAAEVDWLTGLFLDEPQIERARRTLEVVLQSPQFLYRFEQHVNGVLTPAARTARLAFAIADAPPTRPEVDAAALAESVSGRAKLRRFFMRWAGLSEIGTKAEPFPVGAARVESAAFVDRIIAADGRFADLLLRRDVAQLDDALAQLYGVAPDADQLPEQQRAGLLTRVAFLAAHAGPVAPSPIQRGVFVREALLCQPLPPPPPTVDDSPVVRGGVGDDGQPRSIRELTERRTGAGQCAGCHQFINPPGYLFSHYDARGRYVRTEAGTDRNGMPYVVPVEAGSHVPGADLPAELADAVALSAALADSRTAHDCLVRHWLEFVYERSLTPADACDIADLQRQFTASGGRLSVLQTGLARLAGMRLKGAP